MGNTHFRQTAMGAILAVGMAAGCSQNPGGPAAPAAPAETNGQHAHGSTGPQGGHLIELGNGKYHAELAHDETSGEVTIYLLDAQARSAVPIEAAALVINLKHGDEAEQFELAASPAEGDPPGMSSRFASRDAALAERLDQAGADAQLVVPIQGQQLRGRIEHAEHDHDHPDGDHTH